MSGKGGITKCGVGGGGVEMSRDYLIELGAWALGSVYMAVSVPVASEVWMGMNLPYYHIQLEQHGLSGRRKRCIS